MSARLFRVKDVAERYGVDPDTVYRWIRNGRLPCLKLPGGDYRFRQDQLDEFERRRAQNTVSGPRALPSQRPEPLTPRSLPRDGFESGRASRRPLLAGSVR